MGSPTFPTCGVFATNAASYWTRLENSTRSFESDASLVRPIHAVDIIAPVGPNSSDHVGVRERKISSLESLESYLDEKQNREFKTRFISICQKNSWSSLQITKPMIRKLMESHDIPADFLEVPFCFIDCMADEDQTFCVPWTISEDAQSYRVFYTFRYAEHKGHPHQPWVIRQSGVYHQYDKIKKTTLFILLSPMPDSVAHNRVAECLRNNHGLIEKDPLLLHTLVYTSYSMSWREYISEFERILHPIADTTTATLISKPLRVSHDTLGKVRLLESRFMRLPAIITNSVEVIDGLEALSRRLLSSGILTDDVQQRLAYQLDNLRRQARTFVRTADFLQRRSNNTATLLADTLAFRNQGIAQEQNLSMLFLTRSAVFITVITLIYLPWTLVTGIFGMEFFELDVETRRLITSPQIWIYFATATGVTIATICLYFMIAAFAKPWQDQIRRDTAGRFVPASLQRGGTDVEKIG